MIVAAGDFPRRGSLARRLLDDARRVVACDGAARTFRLKTGRWPDLIVGDLDSFPRRPRGCRSEIVRVSEQETNDLEKAVLTCRAHGWRDLVVVGATGRRDDHAIGNVFRMLVAGVPVVTEAGAFQPVNGRLRLTVGTGAPVSVFAASPETRMTSVGLVWPLDGVRFDTPARATLNRAAKETIEVTATSPAFVYVRLASPAARRSGAAVCYNTRKAAGGGRRSGGRALPGRGRK